MKRALLVSALMLGAVASPPAEAVPSVDRVAAATAAFALKDTRGTSYRFDLVARISEYGTSTATGRIDVTLRRCKGGTCTAGDAYRATLNSSQLQVTSDLSAGRLHTQLFGFPLSVSLTAIDSQETVDGKAELYQPVLPSGQVRIWARQTRETSATVTVVQRSCRASAASVFREQIVDGVVLDLPANLPTRLPPAMAGLKSGRCA